VVSAGKNRIFAPNFIRKIATMTVLLTTLNAKYIHTNLAIRLLFELNKAENAGLLWREFTIKEDPESVADYCAGFNVVAFSCYIWNITQTLAVAERIKMRNPNTKILLGGPEVSYDWEDVITKDCVDFIVVGEGEIPFQLFLKSYPDVDFVPSLVRKVNGVVHHNPSSPMFDVQELRDVMPYVNDPVEDLNNKVLYVETSRGCPYKCEFCLASLDNKVRYVPNESTKRTLLHLMKHGRTIKFLDRTFNMKRDFTLDIFQFILENYREGNVFQFEITADILHPDIIKFINEKVPKNLFRFEIGIQTVNQKANLEVSRKQNFEKTKSIIRQLEDKVEMHLDLIVGLALDYWDDIKYSFEEVFKLFAPELQLGFLKFLKGTPVRDKYEQHGFVFDPLPPYQIIESNYLSREELHKIHLCEHALEVYWNKPRAMHTLKYITGHYSIFDFLTGLGIHFSERKDLHQYTLKDVYQILFDYAVHEFPNDEILRGLIAIDYFSFYKVRPEQLFVEELPRTEKNHWVDTLGLNHHKFRHVMFPISFDFAVFEKENRIEPCEQVMIFEYTGTEKPKVIPYSILELA
jgi:anaerobic magnesium-protoporphyrin IX monomethyl ester cyclase